MRDDVKRKEKWYESLEWGDVQKSGGRQCGLEKKFIKTFFLKKNDSLCVFFFKDFKSSIYTHSTVEEKKTRASSGAKHKGMDFVCLGRNGWMDEDEKKTKVIL